MYKTQLQELCVKRMWPLPTYAVSRDGPDHNPRFLASVAVNGVNFDAPDESKTSREAQDKAARVAVDHLAVTLPPIDSPQTPEDEVPYKSQLFMFARTKRIESPKYDTACEVLDHTPLFKAEVTVGGQTFNSLQLFARRRSAENDAAKVALLSLSVGESPQISAQSVVSVESLKFYKNFLQEFVQKEGILLPKYNTIRNDVERMPTFSSTVEFNGETFVGAVAKSKEHAEINAAKVAWCELIDRLSKKAMLDVNLYSTNMATSQVKQGTGVATENACTVDEILSQEDEIAVKNDLETVTMATSSLGQFGMDSAWETIADDSSLQSDRLKELAQKDHILLPRYHSTRVGDSHMPTFYSTVEIGGKTFKDDAANTKKDADKNAA